jgi:hypothetical protein
MMLQRLLEFKIHKDRDGEWDFEDDLGDDVEFRFVRVAHRNRVARGERSYATYTTIRGNFTAKNSEQVEGKYEGENREGNLYGNVIKLLMITASEQRDKSRNTRFVHITDRTGI